MAGETDGAEGPNTNAAPPVVDASPEGGVHEHEEEDDTEPGFQEEQRAEVLQAPELTLDATSTSEQLMGASTPPAETETSRGAVRQRKRRRAKKAAR